MILITGATGLVGSHLAMNLLEDSENIRAIYRNPASMAKAENLFRLQGNKSLFGKIEWVCADITDMPALEKAFAGVTEVYHCAAMISFDPNDERQLRKTNIEGTANIVNCCLEFGVKKLCYVSSIAALGDPKDSASVIDEETEWNPEFAHSDYAISKYGAEMEVWRGFQEGLQVAVVNPGIILGEGFWNEGSGEIFTKVKNGLPFYTKGTTGFVTVNDVVKMLRELMQSTISGERFIAVAEILSFESILKSVANAIDVKAPPMHAKPWLTNIVWRFDWLLCRFGRKRAITKAMARSLHKKTAFSNGKAKSQLHFEFEDVETAVKSVGATFLENR